ncbi:MAG TPA: GNAT family N-acetyltransferase [Actinomycetota bacterium]|nr:GNAT family N-acetyltransferase [Actinomycetota bacterium]
MSPAVRGAATRDLRPREVDALRRLFEAAWADEGFTDDDWEHTVGGVHFLLEKDGRIHSHASVVERELHAGDRPLLTGYVEAVATWPAYRRRGFATAVMREVGAHIDRTFPLGALATGLPGFYEPLGWAVWKGPTFVRTEAGLLRTEEDDGGIMVRATPTSPPLDLSAPISCEWRAGDVW